MSILSFVYSATERERILVLGVCKCGIHRQQSAAHVRLRSLHSRINGVSNEPFRRYRTPAYCTIRANFWFYHSDGTRSDSGHCRKWSCHGGRYCHHDIFVYASCHDPNRVSYRVCPFLSVVSTGIKFNVSVIQHGSNASPIDFHLGEYWSLNNALCLPLRHPGASRHVAHTALSQLSSTSPRQLVIYPTDLIFAALYYPLCTVYCNTILASLNVRSFVRGGSEIRELNPLSTFVVADVVSVRTEV